MSQNVSLVPKNVITPVLQAPPPIINVCANNDQVIIAWQYQKPIIDCVGFAIYRKLNNETDGQADALMNRVGFADESFKKGEQRPSYE